MAPQLSTSAAASASPAASLESHLAAVTRDLERLQAQEADFVQSELQHLREMAILNRMSDALAARRGLEEVAQDVLHDVCNILAPLQAARIVELDADAQPTRVHEPGTAPRPAQSLNAEWQRLIHHACAQPDMAITLQSESAEAALNNAALPMVAGDHLMAVLLIEQVGREALSDAPRQRLIKSLLRQGSIACENALLFESISRLIVNTVVTMALAIESRDAYTGGHVLRVTAYSVTLGQRLGLNEDQLALLRLGGLLHDIGKVAVPDSVLNKPGRLDEQELKIMQAHAVRGDEILRPLPPFESARGIVRHHHERYDGRGYPDRLAGLDIPLLARVTAIADTFDAMTSNRPYRQALAPEIGMREIGANAGTQFDPDMARLFTQISWTDLQEQVAQMEVWLRDNHRTDMPALLRLFTIDRPRLVDRGLSHAGRQ